jgi:hypothetical protein
MAVHVCNGRLLAGTGQGSILKSIYDALNYINHVRNFLAQNNQVCLLASGTGRSGLQWLCMFATVGYWPEQDRAAS